MKKANLTELANQFASPAIMILLGLILLLVPDSASVIIAYLSGGILTLAGIVFGIGALLDRRLAKGFWALACLSIGGTLISKPLLLARNLGRFLGVFLALEGGSCLCRRNRTLGTVILLAAVALVLSPLTLSRLVFSLCGLVVLLLGIGMLADRLKQRKRIPGGDGNIIDAL